MHVAIVGGGLSGTIACLQLLEAGLDDLHITLVERHSRQLNRGVAYSAQLSQQLLNVPAARMGLFPDRVGDFHTWSRSGPSPLAAPEAFLPRRQFGDFVQEQFAEALDRHPGQVTIVRAEAVGAERMEQEGLRILLGNGRAVEADKVLLALGNSPPAHVPMMSEAALAHPGYIPWPWRPGVLGTIAPNKAVVFVGSGLTMVDLVLSLADQGHNGPITVISRRGFLPRPHSVRTPFTFQRPLPDPERISMPALLRWVRQEVRGAEAQGANWQSVIDAIRPHVQDWWQRLPNAERKVFLRHLRPFWEVHRHRMPGAVHERLLRMQADGQLRIIAGRMQGVEAADEGLVLHYRTRGSQEVEDLQMHHLVNCTGPQAESRRIEQPLLVDLLRKDLVAYDALNMGLRSTPVGAAIDGAGNVSDHLFLLGPMCKATLWECTAVPEIRDQVGAVVKSLQGLPA